MSPVRIRVPTIATALVLPSEISSYIALPKVINITVVFRFYVSAKGCVQARTFLEAIPFGVKFDADLYTVFSLWERVALPVFRVE